MKTTISYIFLLAIFAFYGLSLSAQEPTEFVEPDSMSEVYYNHACELLNGGGNPDSVEYYFRCALEYGSREARNKLQDFLRDQFDKYRLSRFNSDSASLACKYRMKLADLVASADQYRECAIYLRSKSTLLEINDSVALAYFYKAAVKGDKFSQAWCYEFGYECTKDITKAKARYQEVFNDKDIVLSVKAKYRYALCLELKSGELSDEQKNEMIRIYQDAAKKGSIGAKLALAIYYYTLEDEKYDSRVQNYLNEVFRGVGDDVRSSGYAAWYIGVCHTEGYCGYQRDKNKAREFFLIAKERGIAEAQEELDKLDVSPQTNDILNSIRVSQPDIEPDKNIQ